MSAESPPESSKPRSFTGRRRSKQTSWSVRAADTVSRVCITVGGIGTIVAVLLVFVFLAYVVLPLFSEASVEKRSTFATPWTSGGPVHVAVDEYQTLGWALYPTGVIEVFRVKDGEVLEQRQLFEDMELTSAAFVTAADDVLLGFSDGTVMVGRIGFDPTFPGRDEIPKQLHDLPAGEEAIMAGGDGVPRGIVTRTPIGQFRLQRVVAELQKPVELAEGGITLLDFVEPSREEKRKGNWEYKAVAFSDQGELKVATLKKRKIMGRRFRVDVEPLDLPFEPRAAAGAPKYLVVSAGAANANLIWEDGWLRRYDIRRPKFAKLAEEVDLLTEGDETVTACRNLIGRETIMVGDSKGGLRAWFLVRQDATDEMEFGDDSADSAEGDAAESTNTGSDASDNVAASDADDGLGVSKISTRQQTFKFAMAHDLARGQAEVTALGVSERGRTLVAGYANGQLKVFYVTTDHLMLETELPGGMPISQAIIPPKQDGLIAANSENMVCWDFEPMHPEATLAALFLPVWYEGYSQPIQMWQSSADVTSEMKLGLYPLIFGTLKATLYSMLFGAPLALLAAIYTSEFVQPTLRTKIKPMIEVMASLPSVVLGFLAALVFAPKVELFVPAVLASFVIVPLVLLAGSYLWQLLPRQVELILNRGGWRLVFIGVALFVGMGLSFRLGPVVERVFFAGQIMRWLDDVDVGNGIGGWLLLLLPLCALIMAVVSGTFVNPALRSKAGRLSRGTFGLINLGKFGAGVLCVFGLALLLSWGLASTGADVRAPWKLGHTDISPIATYVQRNALVVGFVMGFAIIPIIYTIAEDALSTVPKHLRSASLGAGATPWQTTVRVIIPTAMSGLFSAVMVGLGRAVGETMIVLMAAGNTPVMEMNLFNGFRTLSANIAVELPEAVKDSTHYRTLFLAALTLFVMTFIVNTIAEMVRLRFRRRAYQL